MTGIVLADVVVGLGPLQAGDWAYVFQNRGYLLEGTLLTIGLTVASVLLGFLVGFPAGAVEVYGGPISSGLVRNAGVVLRGTPLLVTITFVFFSTPIGSAFVAAVLALGLRSAAYQSQLFRGTLQSVSGGQFEAARAIGLSRIGAIRHVVVPQALRRSIPGFQNEMTIVLKDTSLAYAIGLSELLTRSFNLFQRTNRTGSVLEVLLFAAAIYFVLTFAANRGLDYLDTAYSVPGGETA